MRNGAKDKVNYEKIKRELYSIKSSLGMLPSPALHQGFKRQKHEGLDGPSYVPPSIVFKGGDVISSSSY